MSCPRVDEIGKEWHPDADTPFCMIADTCHLRAVVPVSPADCRLLNEELRRHPELEAAIHVSGTRGRIWRGRVKHLPEEEARRVPVQLTARAGGPLAVEPLPQGELYVPQAQQYLVAVDFVTDDAAMIPGMLAQVKVPCRWRSCGWWLWRTLAAAFDLGLL
jgi:hypothetical protein